MISLKVFGWILLCLGLVLIFYSSFHTYNIFMGKAQPPTVFNVGEEKATVQPPSQKETGQVSKEEIEKIAAEAFQQQLDTMIPKNALPRLLNLVSWSVLAGILIFAGTQISGLGISLLKK